MGRDKLNNARLLAVLGCGVSLASVAPLHAQNIGVEEVIVTAQKQEENIQTVPLAISALTSNAMEAMGITSVEGVALASPSISFTPYPSSSNVLILYIRGQGVSDPMQITSDGSVGLYSDGFYIARPQAATFDLADVERVEVLRGPQGTLYGRNTTGGAVNLISKQPTGEFGFKQTLTFGTLNQFRSLTSVDLPRLGELAAKLTLLKSSIDGYVENTGSSHDYGEEEQQAGRLLLHWGITRDFYIDYFMEMGELNSTPVYYQNPSLNGAVINGVTYHAKEGGLQTRTYRDIDLDESTSDFEGHGLTLTWDATDNFTVKSLTGYRELSWEAFQNYAEVFGGAGFTSHDIVDQHQFSQEFQFVGSMLDGDITYVAGLYYFEEKGAHFQNVGIDSLPFFASSRNRYVTAEAKSKAVFGQLTWAPPILDQRLELTFGARYTKDERSATRRIDGTAIGSLVGGGPVPLASESGAGNDQNFSRFNPSFTANFLLNEDMSFYGKIATGYKAGGSSEAGPVGNFNTTFGPEKVITLEAGLKSYWWDRRVRANIAAFESRFEDMQLAFNVDPADLSVVQSDNAGKATVRGVELSVLVTPIEDLTLGLDYAWLLARFQEVEAKEGTVFVTSQGGPYEVGADIKDLFVLPYAPKNTVNLTGDYTFLRFDKGSLAAHIDYRWQSKVYASAPTGSAVVGRENYAIPSYGVANARITLELELPQEDTARVGLWAKNIFNKDYPQHQIGQGSALAGYSSAAYAWNEPPTYGVDLIYEY